MWRTNEGRNYKFFSFDDRKKMTNNLMKQRRSFGKFPFSEKNPSQNFFHHIVFPPQQQKKDFQNAILNGYHESAN